MKNWFQLDNPFWIFMGKLFDMVLLSVLWLVFSLPVVTIGASTTALYYVALKLANNEGGYTVRSFWQAFKQNLIPGIPLGMGGMVLGAFCSFDIYICSQMGGALALLLQWILLLLTVLLAMISAWLFPLVARCKTDWKHLLVMAFMMAMKNLGWTVLMLVTTLCMLAIGVFRFAPLLALAIGAIAYIHAKIINLVWKDYHLELVF